MAKVSTRNRNKDKFYKDGRKKPANWEYRFPIASVNGVRKHASQAGFRTQKEAYNAGIEALNEYNNGGMTFTKNNISVSDFLDLWMKNHVEINLRPSSQESYRYIINNHLKPAIGHYRLQSVTPMTLSEFLNSYKDKDFSYNRVRSIKSTLKLALDYAVKTAQYIKENPMLYVEMPKITGRMKANHRVVVAQSDWERIIEHFHFGDKYHIPLMIGFHTGLRRSEVLGLTWDDIDLENGIISVKRQQTKYKDEKALWCFAPTKSKSSVRPVKIGDTLLNTLRRENIRQKENRLKYGEYYTKYSLKLIKDDIYELIPDHNGKIEPVCVWDCGKIMTRDTFNYCPRYIRNKLGITIDFHSLRHSHATILAESGVNPKNLQARLGHAHIQTTLQTYIHDTDRMSAETVDIFETALRGHKKSEDKLWTN